MDSLQEIFAECKEIALDPAYTYAKNWKQEDESRVLIGFMPNYFPREIIHAANGLAVGVIGKEYLDPNLNDSNIPGAKTCSLTSGFVQLVNNENLPGFDGFLLPSQCDPLRTLDEIKSLNNECRFVKFINFPQYFQTIIGDIINHHIVHNVLKEIYKINEVKVTQEKLNNSIQYYKTNLKLTERIYGFRKNYPDAVTQDDLYYTVCAGYVMPVEDHNRFLNRIVTLLLEGTDDGDDNIFEVFSGAFC